MLEARGDSGTASMAAASEDRVTGTKAEVKHINLALQGGGAHGAFTWGVLDRLLEDERIVIDALSATSAGAMNATVTAYGLMVGGRPGAKKALESFWRRISHMGTFSPIQPTLLDRLNHDHSMSTSPAFVVFDLVTRLMSPYQFNPLNLNPLRQALLGLVDFDRLRTESPVKLFLCATNVRSGKIKIFTTEDVCVDAVLASGCLPFLFQAVEIDGEAYWDGGYMGNPAIFPLIYNCECSDVVVVHINPIERDNVPTSAAEILNRINEISFNSSLLREMRAIEFITRLIDSGKVRSGEMRRMLIHAIEADHFMQELTPDWEFLAHLRDQGRVAAEKWIAESYDALNVKSTVDVRGRYL